MSALLHRTTAGWRHSITPATPRGPRGLPPSASRGAIPAQQAPPTPAALPALGARPYGTAAPAAALARLGRRRMHICAAAAAAAKPCCKAAAAAAAAASQTAAVSPLVVYSVMAATVYTAVCFLAMLLIPRRSARIFSSLWPFFPLGALYVALLAVSWSPDTLAIIMPGSLEAGLQGFNPQFFPQLEGISTLFSRAGVAASWIVHLLVINLFAGRWCLLQGLRDSLPTFHSVFLCCVFGPLGVLSHFLTAALCRVAPGLKTTEDAVVLPSDKGTITILPYNSS